MIKKLVPILIGTYRIDASITESHVYESDVTEFPVEQGSAISDNIRLKAIMVTIEGVVTDTPIGVMADLRNAVNGDSSFTPTTDAATAKARGDAQSAPSTDALAAMLAIRDARQPVPIATSLQNFENMVLTNLEVPRDATTGSALRFTATFKQITLVTNQKTTVRTTSVRTASPSGQPKKQKGKWATQTGIDGVYVITFPVSVRATATKSFGKPLLTDSYGDHYRVADNSDTKPDGYIGTDNKYHPITVSAGSTTVVGSTINGRPVHYDYGSKSWLDDKNNSVVKTVPSGAERWQGVVFGKNAPGL